METTDNIKLLLENNKDKIKTGKAFFCRARVDRLHRATIEFLSPR